MSTSRLLGIERPNRGAPGHSNEGLGPSDSSDSGSDMNGLDTPDVLDPQLPVDRALADGLARPLGTGDTLGSDSDSAGDEEDESADPVGDGHADAALAASLPPRPDLPNPEPDPPADAPPVSPDGDLPPADDGGLHPPGRELGGGLQLPSR